MTDLTVTGPCLSEHKGQKGAVRSDDGSSRHMSMSFQNTKDNNNKEKKKKERVIRSDDGSNRYKSPCLSEHKGQKSSRKNHMTDLTDTGPCLSEHREEARAGRGSDTGHLHQHLPAARPSKSTDQAQGPQEPPEQQLQQQRLCGRRVPCAIVQRSQDRQSRRC